jgi:uncharacterized protein YkwD
MAIAIASLAFGSPAGALAAHVRAPRAHGIRAHHHATLACRKAHHTHRLSRSCVASLRRSSVLAARKHRHATRGAVASPAAQRAAQRAAAIAQALATPCENTQLTPDPSNLEAVRASVLCLINRQRAQNGVAPLNTDARLQDAAQSHVTELIADDYFAHVSPSGVTPVDRIRTTGYIPGPEFGYLIGENLAWGTLTLSTPGAIVEAWMNSPDHRANILEDKYVDTGIAIAPAVPASLSHGATGATYAQEFGTIIG